MWLVLVKQEPISKFVRNRPPPFQSPLASCSSAPCIFTHHSESFDDVCKMPM